MPIEVPSFSSFELPVASATPREEKKRRQHREDEHDSRSRTRRRHADKNSEEQQHDDANKTRRRQRSEDRDRLEESSRHAALRSNHQRCGHDDRATASKIRNREHWESHHETREGDENKTARSREWYTEALPQKLSSSPVSGGRQPLDVSSHSSASAAAIRSALSDWPGGVLDTRGDHVASRYEGPEGSRVPEYKRCGRGLVLGLPAYLRIVSSNGGTRPKSSNGLEIGRTWRDSAEGLSEKHWVQFRRPARRRITPTMKDDTFGEQQEGFVSLATARGQRSERDPLATAKVTDKEHESRETDNEDEDISLADDEEDESQDAIGVAAQKARIKTTDARTRSQPDDVMAWLTLADLQKQLLHARSDDAIGDLSATRSARRKAVTEVQLSVVDKARRSHPRNAESTSLSLARLQIAISGHLWSDDTVEEEFRHCLSSLSASSTSCHFQHMRLAWARYLEWVSSSSSSSLTKVCNAYSDALRDVSNVGSFEALDLCFVLQLQLCTVLERSGYPAKAFAILQAQLELAFDDTGTEKAAVDRLRRHWNSEEPRLGEPDTRHLVEADVIRVGPTAQHSHTIVADSDYRQMRTSRRIPDPLDQWVATQRDLTALHRRPARSDDLPVYSAGEGEVDPFSIIAFADIEHFLVSSRLEAGRARAINNLLSYLRCLAMLRDGVVLPVRSEAHQIGGCDACLAQFWPSLMQESGEGGHDRLPSRSGAGEASRDEQRSRLSDPWKCPLLHVTRPFDALLFERVEAHTMPATEDVAYLRLLLRQAVTRSGEHSVIATALQLAIAGELRDQSTFADLLRQPSATPADRAVLLKSAFVALDPHELLISISDMRLRVVDAVELTLAKAQPDGALAILERAASGDRGSLSALNGEGLSTTVAEKLKARRYYSKSSITALFQDDSTEEVDHITAAAWYHYLVQPPDRALAVVIDFFEGLIHPQTSSTTNRYLCEARLRILWYHLSRQRSFHRPADVRAILVETIRLFPDDLTFIALLAAHEARFKVEGVVRRVLSDSILGPLEESDGSLSFLASATGEEIKSPFEVAQRAESKWLMAIYIELHFNPHVVNYHSVRSLFQRAVQQDVTRTSHTLWSMYLSFEVKMAKITLTEYQQKRRLEQQQRRHDTIRSGTGASKSNSDLPSRHRCQKLLAGAKGVFWQAISACPMDRQLYMTAFQMPLRLAFERDELLQLFSVMFDERELRVFGRVDARMLDEVEKLENRDGGGKSAQSREDEENEYEDGGED